MVSLMSIINFKEKDNKNLIEVRKLLEAYVTTTAIGRALKDNIKELSEIINRMEENINNYDIFSDYDYHFHIRLAKASNNPIFYELIKGISELLKKEIKEFSIFKRDRKKAQRLHKAPLEVLVVKDKGQ
ncbi:MAG: FCD domain-containing protein [Actinomycetota bacterium]|nr:FCD domain-containing protein [Actinomycetota bacterium]